MKIATFNANSIRVRLPIILDWLEANQPDILAVQETKVEDALFPQAEIQNAGWHVEFHGQRSRNGVALISRIAPSQVRNDFEGDSDWQPDCRLISARYGDLWVLNTYVPNGASTGTPPFQYKLDWLDRFSLYVLEQFQPSQPVIWLGDINIAPQPIDVFDSRRVYGKVGHHPNEFRALERCVFWGWQDLFRKLHPEARQFTFWDYRMPKTFERNLGWRIDHIYASPALAPKCSACVVDEEPRAREKPSDHTFVWAELEV